MESECLWTELALTTCVVLSVCAIVICRENFMTRLIFNAQTNIEMIRASNACILYIVFRCIIMISENKSFPVQYVLCACTCNFMLSSRLQWCIATYNATLTPWTDHFRSRSDDQWKGRLLFLCIASVQQLGPAPFRAPSSSIVTPDNYSSCPRARQDRKMQLCMYTKVVLKVKFQNPFISTDWEAGYLI